MISQDALAGFQAMAGNFIPLISGSAAKLYGLWLVAGAVIKMIKMGDTQSGERVTWFQVGGMMMIGAFMLQFSSTMQDVSSLLFGSRIQDYHGALAYMPMPEQSSSYYKKVLEVCLLWLVMLGWAGAFRGFAAWAKAANGAGNGQDGDQFWKGLWHIFGGAALINLTGAFQAFYGH